MTSYGRSGEFDDLPAFGLRDDAFDDAVREGFTRYTPVDDDAEDAAESEAAASLRSLVATMMVRHSRTLGR